MIPFKCGHGILFTEPCGKCDLLWHQRRLIEAEQNMNSAKAAIRRAEELIDKQARARVAEILKEQKK